MKNPKDKILTILLAIFVVLTSQTVQAQFCTYTSQNIQCNGESTGIISFTPIGGTPPYDYEWSHDNAINTNEFFDLPADIYSVTISDQGGMTEICTVLLSEPTPITITNVTEVNPMCGLMDGSFEITAVPQSGGSQSDLMYSIDGGVSFQTSNTFTGLGANDYLIIVADISGCFIVDSRQLVDATAVVVNLNTAMCEAGGTIMIDIDPSGGTLPYDFIWSNGFITEDLVGVPEGSYSVTVTDREGCSDEASYTVDNCCDSSMFCNGTIQDISCNGGTDGSISLNPTGGGGTYSYQWFNGSTSNAVSDLGAGFYNVTVTDNTGCTTICGFDLIDPSAIEIIELITSDPTCGGTDGAITITATPQSNSTIADLIYSVDGINFQASNSFTGLASGTYNVTVNDANGCSVSLATQLNDGGGITVNLVNSSCDPANTVSLEVMATGGVGPFTYSWTGPMGYTGTGASISGVAQGTYIATATDAIGCSSTLTVTQDNCCDNSMFCTSTSTNPDCNGASTGSINITPNGGTGPFTYNWSHDALISSAMAENLSAGFYNITITDAGACSTVCGIEITEPSAIVINDVVLVEPMCNLPSGSMTINATPKSGSGCNDLEYSIDGGMNYQISNQFNDLISGDYLVIVRDCNACMAVESSQLMNTNGVAISFSDACANGITDIDVTPLGGTGPYTFSWTGPNGFSATSEDLIAVPNGDYTIVITDADGCSDQTTIVGDVSCVSGNIQGVVWEDVDGDGSNDFSESGLGLVPVSLFNANEVLISTVFSDNGGGYIFEGQDPGQYFLHFGTPSEYSFTLPNVGDDAEDSDVSNAFGTGTTALINYTGGDVFIDAGVHLCIPVGELVWFDLNENDQWDEEENGINGIEVKVWKKGLGPGYYVYDYTHTGPKPNTASDDGYYKFCLPPGTYYLEYIIPPFGLVPVVSGVGGAINDSDLTGNNGPGTTNSFTLLSGDEKCDLSAGYYPMATLGNNIFLDGNSNGIADPGEFGMGGVTIELYHAASNQMIESQETNNDGNYLFDYLQKTEYYLKVVPPNDYLVTIPNMGDNEDMDSDIDNSNGPNTSAMYALTPGMTLENVDIGLIEGSVVAVDWVSVSGENRGAYNQIEWTVGFQHNTDYFEVERRTPDEFSYTTIGEVARTNGISMTEYNFSDTDIEGLPLTYYRIVEYDVNGNRSYSDVVSVDNRLGARATKVSVGPNPFISDLIIELDTPDSGEASFTFFDANGRLVNIAGQNKAELNPGINTLTFDWSGIASGVYTTHIIVGNKQFVKKLIKIE